MPVIGIPLLTSCHVDSSALMISALMISVALSVPINATCQCPSMPVPHQCLPVHINATYQCPSELPFSAAYQFQSVLPISAIYECCLSVPISATYQCLLISAAYQCPSLQPH
ncbi:unnamed protein product [Staurois parvus]|uniref:Uncharacterized protein n=1 Tax=Staurois parvus TaxID=386267 RepID=A0ABN9EC87_9NEOB|nr:unnamed protein product [Staurois parvus]